MKRLTSIVWHVSVAAALLTTTACGDPQAAKQRSFEKANQLASQGKYAEAILQYRSAIKIDPQFGEAHFKLAEAYVHSQNLQQAVAEFRRAADLLPRRDDVQTKAAYVQLAAGDFDGARNRAEAALKTAPKNVDAQIVLAYALAGLKDTTSAVKELETAMQMAPDDARPYTSLGAIRAREGNRQEAEAAFRKAVEIDSRSVAARLALAYYYWSTQRVNEAEALMKEALAINRDDALGNRLLALFYLSRNRSSDAETPLLRLVNAKDAGATLTLADLYVHTGRSADAMPLYESLKGQKGMRAVAIARAAAVEYAQGGAKREAAYRSIDQGLKEMSNNPELLTLKAQWLTRDHRLDEGLDAAKKAVASAPESAAAKYALGRAQSALGQREQAITALTDAVRLNPKFSAAEIELARLQLQRGDVHEALKHAQAVRATQPGNHDARVTIAAALLAKRDVAGAEAELKSLQTDAPQSPQVHSLSGQVLLVKGDAAGAMREFDKALQLNPSDLHALSGRLMVDLRSQKPQDGRARLQRALAQSPNNADLLIVAARFETTVGDIAAAEQYLRKAIEVDPANLDAYNMLAGQYVRANRLEDAKRELQEIAKRRPDSVAVRTMIGMILDTQRRHDESQKIYESIVNGSARAPVASNNLAYIYAMRGEKLDTALHLAQEAKAELPDNPEVNDTLGWVYYKKNMPKLAIAPLQLSIQKDPRNPVFHYHLGLAYAGAGEPDKARQALEQALKLKPDFDGADEARSTLASLKG